MQDFMFGNIKKQDTGPEPYTVYNKEQALEPADPKKTLMRDMEYFRSLYPERVKTLQLVVEEVCDDMDYQDSPMYDEYPDRVFMEQLFHKVLDKTPEKAQENNPETETQMNKRESVETYEIKKIITEESVPHMPYGPENMLQAMTADRGTYRTWEMDEERLEAEQLANNWGPPPPPPHPWGPPPPPPRPWGPPPPPPRPWGPPPPPPRPWGPPPPPPPHPWLPPPPPPHPWGPPPPPPPDPWGPRDMDDIIRLLLFGEMQKRRCNGRHCR